MSVRLRLPDKYAGMNKVETEWALTLEANKRATYADSSRSIVLWRYESVRFIFAKGTSYLPDFWCLYADGHVELHEVKAVHRGKKGESRSGWKATASVKFKTAADLFPELEWVAVEKQIDGTFVSTRAEDLFRRGPK